MKTTLMNLTYKQLKEYIECSSSIIIRYRKRIDELLNILKPLISKEDYNKVESIIFYVFSNYNSNDIKSREYYKLYAYIENLIRLNS